MQEAVLSSIIVQSFLNRMVVVKPIEHCLPRKSNWGTGVELVGGWGQFEDILSKGKGLRIQPFASHIIIADSIVGRNS
jgi:hypothetical protein